MSHLKFLGTSRMKQSEFHTEDPQILGATVLNTLCVQYSCAWIIAMQLRNLTPPSYLSSYSLKYEIGMLLTWHISAQRPAVPTVFPSRFRRRFQQGKGIFLYSKASRPALGPTHPPVPVCMLYRREIYVAPTGNRTTMPQSSSLWGSYHTDCCPGLWFIVCRVINRVHMDTNWWLIRSFCI
jgi:hypothetical protein